MKRLIALVVLLLLGFYVAWPGWTGYQIADRAQGQGQRHARAQDRVRRRARIAEARRRAEGRRGLRQQLKRRSARRAPRSSARSRPTSCPKIADTALTQLVTAPNLIRVVNDGGTLKQNAERILKEQIGKIGLPGLGGGAGGGGGRRRAAARRHQAARRPRRHRRQDGIDPAVPGMPGAAAAHRRPSRHLRRRPARRPPRQARRASGSSNIKRFGFLGPLAFEIGVAKDADGDRARRDWSRCASSAATGASSASGRGSEPEGTPGHSRRAGHGDGLARRRSARFVGSRRCGLRHPLLRRLFRPMLGRPHPEPPEAASRMKTDTPRPIRLKDYSRRRG